MVGQAWIVFEARSGYAPRPSELEHKIMRADVEAASADIEQSIGLLRRRL